MKRNLTLRIFTLAAFGLLILCPRISFGQSGEEAKKHFEQGAVLYNEGNYAAALVEFKESYKLKPSWKVRYHVGVTLEALHKFTEAEKELKAYLDEGGKEILAEKKKEVEGILDQLGGVIGSLTVAADVEGASVFCSGDPVGKTPLEAPLRLDVGHYKVKVTKEGYEDYSTEIDLPGGKLVVLNAKLTPLKAGGPAAPGKSGQGGGDAGKKKTKSPLMIYGWATLGAGAALLVAGAATGGAALSLGSDLEGNCPRGECGPAYHDDNNRMKSLALGTNVLLGLGGACVLTGVVLLAVGSKAERKPKKKPSVSLLSPAGLVLTWRY